MTHYEMKENRCGHWVVYSTRWTTKTGENYPLYVFATLEEAKAKIAAWETENA